MKPFIGRRLPIGILWDIRPVETMMGIYLSAGDQELLEEKTKALGIFIREMQQQEVLMIGPADAALTRLNDRYRKVIYLKSRQEEKLLLIKNKTEHYLEMDAGWEKIRVQFDMNPFQAY